MKGRLLFLDAGAACAAPIAAALLQHCKPESIEIVSAAAGSAVISPALAKSAAAEGIAVFAAPCGNIDAIKNDVFDCVIWITGDQKDAAPLLPGPPIIIRWQVDSLPPEPSAEECRQFIAAIREKANALHRDGYLAALLSHKRTINSIMGGLPVGVVAHDMDRTIVYFSPQAERITGFSASDVIGRDCHTVFTPGLCGDQCHFCDGAPADRFSHLSYSSSFLTRDGQRRELDMSVVPLLDENETQIGVLASFADQTALHRLEREVEATTQFAGIIGQDHAMQLIYDTIRDLAQCDFSVVISGESGTGKELIAHAIHAESPRKNNLFVPVNCGALPEGTLESELFGHVKGAFTGAIRDKKGRFELAHKGTLFLDEAAELSQPMQVKLLRVLQEGTFEPVGGEKTITVDVRIICATNKDLKERVRTGEFREDLYYRLAVVPIHVPPLRERRNDISILADHFLEKFSARLGRTGIEFSDATRSLLMSYAWPGNVRQLQNAIQFALIKSRGVRIEVAHLPPEITQGLILPSQPGEDAPAKAGRKPKLTEEIVTSALRRTAGNKARAARMLGVGRATLYNFLAENPHLEKLGAA